MLVNAKMSLKNSEEFKLENSLFPDADFKINASIVSHANRFWCAYRTDNMDKYDAKNYLTELDHKLSPISHKKLTAENANTAFEDVRLFSFDGKMIAIYTYLPGNIKDGWVFEYGVGIGIIDLETGVICQQKSLREYARAKHSKNWIPYIHNDDLFLITDFDPYLKILKSQNGVGFEFQEVYSSTNRTASWNYGELRGGTPFIPNPFVKDNWLYSFVHSHINLPNGLVKTRFYVYTVLRLNSVTQKFQYYKIPIGYSQTEGCRSYSRLWIRATRNSAMKVVFPMGLTNYSDGILMSYGKDDCVSRIVFYKWDYIAGLF